MSRQGVWYWQNRVEGRAVAETRGCDLKQKYWQEFFFGAEED